MAEPELHENLSRDDEVVGSSDRSFGMTFAAIGLIVGVIKLWRGHDTAWWWWIAAAATLAAAAWACPAILAPLNRLWLRLGLVLYKIVNPVVMALIFYGAVLPTGLLMRACGKDPLRLKRLPAESSYWIARDPPGPPSDTMKHQF